LGDTYLDNEAGLGCVKTAAYTFWKVPIMPMNGSFAGTFLDLQDIFTECSGLTTLTYVFSLASLTSATARTAPI
jgi:hypothetical protein